MDKIALAQKINSLTGLSKEEKAELTQLLHTKRYGLVWEDKPEAVEEELKTQLPVLHEVTSKKIIAPRSVGRPAPEGGAVPPKTMQQPSQLGLSFTEEKADEKADEKAPPSGAGGAVNHSLIEGDNLHALTVLNYTHANKIDVIYIDPPYNTGNKDFKYNDSFVDKEDGYRHSKWLSFMAKRLRLAKNLLSDKGVIFISIDDNEQAQLKLLCDEVFGEVNFVGDIIWQHSVQGKNDAKTISLHHNYTLIYSKPNFQIGKINRTEVHNKAYSNPDNDPNGAWRSGDVRSPNYRENLRYSIITPTGKEIPPPTNGWRWEKNTLNLKIVAGEVVFNKDESKITRKIYLDNQDGRVVESIWFGDEVGTTRDATAFLKVMFGETPFDTPKPIQLLNRILSVGSQKDSTILDFFAGSGTTLHAVMALNAEDGGSRQCILVTNNENNICEEVTYERNKRVIEGYTNAKGDFVAGLGGNNLRYYRTGYVPKATDEINKRLLTQSCTDLLCIKENCYDEITVKSGFEPSKIRVFKTEANGNIPEKYMIVVYHSRQPVAVFKQLKLFINALETCEKIRVYAFSSGKDSLEAELIDVADKIEAVPLPDAIANAYNACFKILKTQHSNVEIKTENTIDEA